MVIVLYGPAKAGKSVAAGVAAAAGAVISAPEAVSAPLRTLYGINVSPVLTISTGTKMSDIIKAVGAAPKDTVVLIDDLTLYAKNYLTGAKTWAPYKILADEIGLLMQAGRDLTGRGGTLIITCHESAPKTKDGAAIRGGPSLWGAMAENLSGHADCVWRTVYEPAAIPWPWVVASRSAEYVAGDRLNVMPDRGPLNVAEALRLAGVACKRPEPLRWMDEAVPALASEILSAGIENWRETVRADGKLRSVKEKGARLLYVMDALDRAKLIAHKDQPDFWEAESAASSDGL